MEIGKFKIILPFLILLTFGFQCGKDEDDQYENIFELDLPFNISPIQKEYRINDTIEISAIIENKSLLDLNTQALVEIECTDIPITFYIGVRLTNFNELNSDNLFEIIVDTLNFQNFEIENNGQYSKFKANISEDIFNKEEISTMKIIPKRKGIYMMDPSNFKDIFINRNENCNETNPTLDKGKMNYIFNVSNSNPELLVESPFLQMYLSREIEFLV